MQSYKNLLLYLKYLSLFAIYLLSPVGRKSLWWDEWW